MGKLYEFGVGEPAGSKEAAKAAYLSDSDDGPDAKLFEAENVQKKNFESRKSSARFQT